MKLSVIILNYNVRYFLELCLESVQQAISDIKAEIIVVDNNSQDDSCEMVKFKFPDITLIQNKENLGFSRGNNIGVLHAKGEYLCILNPDTIVAENTFIDLLNFAESKSNLGIVGCKLIDGRGNYLPESKRNIPSPKVALKKILGYSSSYYDSLNLNEIGKTSILVGAFMLLKKEVYEKVGGFDEGYFMYGEDIDLSYKILKKGYENYYYGRTSIIHFKGESTIRDKTFANHFYGAMQIFYKKHFKKSKLFGFLVKQGIKLAYTFRTKPVFKKHKPLRSVICSKSDFKALKLQLPQPVIQTSKIESIVPFTIVFFDSKLFTFKVIIEAMLLHAEKEGVSFRIISKNGDFTIGSDSTNERGEVLKI